MKLKKHILKSFTICLTFTLCFMFTFGFSNTVQAANEPVKLAYAKYTSLTPGFHTHYQCYGVISGYVRLSNIGYRKNVTIHYTTDNEHWNDCSARYCRFSGNNQELWSFSMGPFLSEPFLSLYCRFAIKYEVNGKTYWDNNNGNDYHIRVGFGASPSQIGYTPF